MVVRILQNTADRPAIAYHRSLRRPFQLNASILTVIPSVLLAIWLTALTTSYYTVEIPLPTRSPPLADRMEAEANRPPVAFKVINPGAGSMFAEKKPERWTIEPAQSTEDGDIAPVLAGHTAKPDLPTMMSYVPTLPHDRPSYHAAYRSSGATDGAKVVGRSGTIICINACKTGQIAYRTGSLETWSQDGPRIDNDAKSDTDMTPGEQKLGLRKALVRSKRYSQSAADQKVAHRRSR
ncbi:MAG: hypothetical protein AAFV45_13325 [Pseudomonadota bacterium]